MRPLKNAFNVPGRDFLNGHLMPLLRLTCAIIHTDFISHVLEVIVGCNSYITPKCFWTPSFSGIRHIACILKCFVCSVQEYTLLRIHALGLARADLEEPVRDEDRLRMII